MRVVWTASRSGVCSLHAGRSGGQAPPRPKALSEDSSPLPGLGGTVTPPPSLESVSTEARFRRDNACPLGSAPSGKRGQGGRPALSHSVQFTPNSGHNSEASRATRNELPTGSSRAGRARPGARQTQAAGGPDQHPLSSGHRNPACLCGGGVGTKTWPRAPGMTELCLPFASSLPLPFPPTKGANTEEKIKKINAHTMLSVRIYGQLHGVGGRKT